MSKHTPEPWKSQECVIRKDGFFEGGARDNAYIGECDKPKNATRIVACVNACADMENPQQEIEELRSALKELFNSALEFFEDYGNVFFSLENAERVLNKQVNTILPTWEDVERAIEMSKPIWRANRTFTMKSPSEIIEQLKAEKMK